MAEEQLFVVKVKVTNVVEVLMLAEDEHEASRLGSDAAAAGVGAPAEGEPTTAEVLGVTKAEWKAGYGGEA